jgi:DNA invertase Pin-like site-specific DNA recombinase
MRLETHRSKNVSEGTRASLWIILGLNTGSKADQKYTFLERDTLVYMRVALYARVSTRDKGQDYENQLRDLRSFVKAHAKDGWDLEHEYVDQASGKDSDRVQFKQLFKDASRRNFDLVLFWSLDRFSREGVLETLQSLQRLTAAGVDYRSYTEQYLDSCGIFREAVLSILATIAKQERVRIRERTIAGLERVRAQGTRLGRPRLVVDRERIRRMREEGKSLAEIARCLQIGKSSVHRILAAS